MKSFHHKDEQFYYTAELVDSYYGPEMKVRIYDHTKNLIAVKRECATPQQIINWWMEDRA